MVVGDQFASFPEEVRNLHDAAIDFAKKRLACLDLIERDRECRFDRDAWLACAEFGVFGMPVPEQYSGTGLGLTALLAVMEGLGYACPDQGLLFSINAHLWTNTIPLLRYGSEEQKAKYLPGLVAGTTIGANGASEPDAGSDVFSMRTRAVRRGDAYVLNGQKTWVSNGPVADIFVVYATLDPEAGPMGVTGFVIERDNPGLSLGKEIHKMGLRTSPMCTLTLEDCEVPVSARLGREGRGVSVFECSMEWERGCILAPCLGAMRRLLETCVDYARQRRQFGKPIGKFQSVANKLVDMRVRLDSVRPLVYRVGQLKDSDRDAMTEAAIAKIAVAEAYVESCEDAIQVFGGSGYTEELGIERELRNAIASRIYSGTSEIQRTLVARGLGL